MATAVILLAVAGGSTDDVAGQAPEPALAAFLAAPSALEADAAAGEVVRSGVAFERAYAALKRGRTYAADVATGAVRLSHRIGDLQFAYSLDVPASYDPARTYQVRIQLHGGVMRPEGSIRGDGGMTQLVAGDRDRQIFVIPNAWRDAPWWAQTQIDNLRLILDAVKRRYNVDENRVVLSGLSDGGTAAFYVAMRDTTPFASYLPLIGHVIVLRNSEVQPSDLYPHNLVNKPLFIVNGGRDRLYPASRVTPFVEHFQKGGATIKYLPQRDGGHDIEWWPAVRDDFDSFVRQHPREPHPKTLTWETDGSAPTVRSHWLTIDELAPRGIAAPLPDLNEVADGEAPGIGIRNTGTRVTAVLPGSCAERLGLKPGDRIARLNERILPREVDVLDLLGLYQPGDALSIRVIRDNNPVDLKGTYEPSPLPRVMQIFPRTRPSGRVDIRREGNTFTASTRGVARFSLLLSPDAIDFSKPVTVVADGRTVFNGKVSPSVSTLMKWTLRDGDRTMLYGAELQVTMTPQ